MNMSTSDTSRRKKTSAKPEMVLTNDLSPLRPFFPIYCHCDCSECRQSIAFDSAALPCWLQSKRVTGGLYKMTFYQMVISPHENDRTDGITLFSELVLKKKKKKEEMSDIVQLRSIDEEEIYDLLDVDSFKPWSKKLIELAKQILVWAWKLPRELCDIFCAVQSQGEKTHQGLQNKNRRETSYDAKLFKIFSEMIMYLIMTSLSDDEEVNFQRLAELNNGYHCPLGHIFFDGQHTFPWAACYFANFSTFYKFSWCHGMEEGNFSELDLPTCQFFREAEKPTSVTCDVCGGCSVGIVYPLIFHLSRDISKFPREVLSSAKFISPNGSVVVCSTLCVLEVQRSIYKRLNEFVGIFGKTSFLNFSQVRRNERNLKQLEVDRQKCQMCFRNIESLELRRLILVGIPVNLDLEFENESYDEIFHNVDLPGSSAYNFLMNAKTQMDLFTESLKSKNFGFRLDITTSRENPLRELIDQHSSLQLKIINQSINDRMEAYTSQITCPGFQENDSDHFHQDLDTASFLFRSRWANVNPSIAMFSRTDFIVKLTPVFCSGLNQFQQNVDDPRDELRKQFGQNSTFCLIGINNGYVNLSDLVFGVKFLITDKSSCSKMNPFVTNFDFLLFIRDLNFLTKTCYGGLLYKNGNVISGVVLRDAFNFFMESSDLDNFLKSYNTYEKCNFDLEKLLNKLAPLEREKSDEKICQRNRNDWKFGLLRLEFFRETRKQQRKHKLPVLTLPQKVFIVSIRIKLLHSPLNPTCACESERVVWKCTCLGEIAIGQVLRWYRDHWGFDGDKLKFYHDKPLCGSVDQNKLVSDFDTGDSREISIIAEFLRKADQSEFRLVGLVEPMLEEFMLARLVVQLPDNSQTKLISLVTLSFGAIFDWIGIAVHHTHKLLLRTTDDEEIYLQVPWSSNLRHIQDVYAMPKNEEIVLRYAPDLDDTILSKIVTEGNLTFNRPHILSVREGLFDNHFSICPGNHRIVCRSKLITEFLHFLSNDIVISACDELGSSSAFPTGCCVAQMVGISLSNMDLSKIIASGLATNSYCYVASLSSKISEAQLCDQFPYYLRGFENQPGSMMLVSWKSETTSKMMFAFLKQNKQKSALIFMLPKKMEKVEEILGTELTEKLSMLEESLKHVCAEDFPHQNIDSVQCSTYNRLPVVNQSLCKFSNEPPISSEYGSGLEGLVMFVIPSDRRSKDWLATMKSIAYLEFYDYPMSKLGKIVWSDEKFFILRFHSEEFFKRCIEKGQGIAMSFYIREENSPATRNCYSFEVEDLDVSKQTLVVWKYDTTLKQVIGMFPPKKIQNKAMHRLVNASKWKFEKPVNHHKTAFQESDFKSEAVDPEFPPPDDEVSIIQEKTKTDVDGASSLSLKNSLLNLMDDILQQDTSSSDKDVNELSPCFKCHSISDQMFFCHLCESATFCSKDCYEKSSKHFHMCEKKQFKRNLDFLKTL